MDHKQINQSALLDAIYGAAVEPRDYLAFAKVWDATILKFVEHEGGRSLRDEAEAMELRKHFNRAFDVFEKTRLGRKQSVQSYLDSQAFAAALCRKNGTIAACNERFIKQFDLDVEDDLGKLIEHLSPMSAATFKLTNQAALSLRDEQTAYRYAPSDRSACLIIVEPFQDLSTVSTPNDALYLIRSNQLEWSSKVEAFLKESFLLTEAEAQIAENIMSGQRSDEIAVERGRTKGTVRQQIKSILEKTETTKQVELMALLVSLHHLFATRPEKDARVITHHRTENSVHQTIVKNTPLWGHIEYEVFGANTGTPVAFFHSQMSSAVPTTEWLEAVVEQNLLVCAPKKPGLGSTDMERQKTDPVGFIRAFVSQMEADGFSPAALIGQGMSGVAAIDYAATYPEYAGKVVTIDTGIPFTRREQFEHMPPVSKRIFWTVWDCPELFYAPFAFASEALFASEEGERAFMHDQFKDIPHDHALIQDPYYYDIAKANMRNFMSTPKRSADELVYWMHDWTAPLEALAKQRDIVFLQSELHDFLRFEDIESYLAVHPRAKAKLLRATAQLCLLEMPETIAQEIRTAIDAQGPARLI